MENQCSLGVPIFKPIIIRLQCAQILGHLKIINFPLRTNGKFIILGVSIPKHITVCYHAQHAGLGVVACKNFHSST